MDRTYRIIKAVWGTHGIEFAYYEPGVVLEPGSKAEVVLLDHLVRRGFAEVVRPTTRVRTAKPGRRAARAPKKKEA